MNILVLDSSFNKMQAANYSFSSDDNYQVLSSFSAQKGSQGEQALEILQEIATDPTASKLYAEYKYVMFNRGPGSFVGTRISTSLTQGIATVNPEVKVIAVSSLEMLAQQIRLLALLASQHQLEIPAFTNKTKIFVAIDANMGESYVASFNWHQLKDTNELILDLAGKEQLIKKAELEQIYLATQSSDLAMREQIIAANNYTHKFGFEVKDQVILVGNAWNKYYPAGQTLVQQLSDEVVARQLYPLISGYFQKHLLIPKLEQNQRVTIEEDLMDDIFAFFEQITELPDVRFLAPLIIDKIKAQDFTSRLNIEPTYIRDKVTY
ncbi:tRNA (adenosine(37)-N6)-threonylcarbamoyltransferase complex dimerization subunit type 1 TsaB [Psittacicella gerlachiana]|uniref:tRNA threonylcarbamoyladenosine biosynthesis protein TsaB n=1 Tax=Psittacicella gerlachiana TaxID=2028574 RepID=A0A3A1YB48_9GAMM|nr:tRNA (adenosine(37)-N6)-threonylcarbamoyltransferase complex dimerization subunit type 1 TsaB [Psittacicella gerlachiana]RIY34761.1 tRNA (adenosine(37)-N6)-threonylcarbamoyltransferase complex dimerization subunit type 1 TsaB [Psittacicella gerlachiana]